MLGNYNPYGFDVDTLSSEGRSPHESIERQNSEMARAFHAQIILMGTQGNASNVGSYNLGSNQKDLLTTVVSGIMKQISSHINQYLIAQLIDLNFAERYYPEFKFDEPNQSVVDAVFDAFKLLVQKDRVSDDMAKGIEEATAGRLDIDIEALKKRREESEATEDEKKNKTSKEDEASNGDKFLSEEEESTAIIGRELTEAEKNVKFEAIEKWTSEQELTFEKAATAELDAAIGGIDSKKSFTLPQSYVSLLERQHKAAYDYGKLAAADEQKLPAPALKAESKARIKRYVDFIVKKQTNDVQALIDAEKLKLPLALADEEVGQPEWLTSLIAGALAAWIMQAVQGTKGTIVSQGFADGREDSFRTFDAANDNDVVYQWSSVMEANTCAVCSALDSKTLDKQGYAVTIHKPQKHFNCKCVWVRIEQRYKEYKLPDISGINDTQIERIEHIVKTPKSELIKTNPIAEMYTKNELASFETYVGNGYHNINGVLRGTIPPNSYATADIANIDKGIARRILASDTELFRGVGLPYGLKVGSEIPHSNYMSTSTSQVVGNEFAKGADGNKYLITLKGYKDMPYFDVTETLREKALDEHEYLLNRGKTLVVKKVGKSYNGVTMIEAEFSEETKMLSDNDTDDVTGDDIAFLKAAEAEARANPDKYDVRKNRDLKNLYDRWQDDSDYLAKNPDLVK